MRRPGPTSKGLTVWDDTAGPSRGTAGETGRPGAAVRPDSDASLRRFRTRAVPAGLLPSGAAHAVSLDEGPADPTLAAAMIEDCIVDIPVTLGRAVRSRVRGYLAGRHCAGRALARLTAKDSMRFTAIPSSAMGAPLWPQGVVGSISHSARIAMAAVDWSGDTLGLGIDCERVMDAATIEDVLGRILPEAGTIARHGRPEARMPWPEFVTMGFSVKESVYKCLHPVTGVFFDFDAVAIDSVDIAAGEVSLRVLEPLGDRIGAGTLLTARFCVEGDHVFTAVRLTPTSGVRVV